VFFDVLHVYHIRTVASAEAVTKETNSFWLNFIGSIAKSINQARVFSPLTTP
jgi:hypothetical protein